MAAHVESELKFALTRADFNRLSSGEGIDDLVVGTAETAELSSTYFDTPDQRLRKAGLTLRVRRTGAAFEQTVKAGGLVGALAARDELTAALTGEAPDLALLAGEPVGDLVMAALDGAVPEAAFTIRVTRSARMLVTRDGDEIEYVLDDGEAIAGARRAPILEAEFELKGGDPRALFHVAKRALATVPVRFSTLPKSERGYRLAAGEADAPPAPAKAAEADIDGDASVEQTFQAILRSCLAQIATNVAAVETSDDIEGPHQLRVGLRRLRSALSVFKPVIERPVTARLETDGRWLGALVGELRDLDVLVDEIVAPCAERIDVKALTALLNARRADVRSRLVVALQGPRVGAFLIDLAAYTEGRGWLSFTDIEQSAALSEPIAVFAERALHKRWAKVARMGRDLDALSGEERHDLRKAFKKLRYALDFFGGVIAGKDRRKLMRDVKAAQEVLGYLNDVRMAHAMADLTGSAKRGDVAAVERAVGFCLGWHEAQAERIWADQRSLAKLDEREF